MDDVSHSKAAKKNKKRHNKKAAHVPSSGSGPDTSSDVTPADLIPLLKQQLEQAKINKDHAEAGKLREQLWILSDLAAGIRTDMPADEYKKIIDSLPLPHRQAPGITTTDADSSTTGSQTGSNSTPAEKRLKALNKKLDQIEKLKEKKAKGETIQENQEEKIKSEPEIKQEIEELEELMRTLLSGS